MFVVAIFNFFDRPLQMPVLSSGREAFSPGVLLISEERRDSTILQLQRMFIAMFDNLPQVARGAGVVFIQVGAINRRLPTKMTLLENSGAIRPSTSSHI